MFAAVPTVLSLAALLQPRLPMASANAAQALRHLPVLSVGTEVDGTVDAKDSFAWAAPRLALLAMAGTCGANFPLIHMTEAQLAPADVSLLRFGCALLPFVPSLMSRLSEHGRQDYTMVPGLEIGFWCSIGYVTQAIGLSQTSPARGAFICALFLVVTPLLNGVQGRRVEAQAWLAVCIALTGTAFLEGLLPMPFGGAAIGGGGAAAAGASVITDISVGDLWCGGTALGFGAMFSRMESHMAELPEEAALPMTIWQLVALFASCVVWRLSQIDGGWSSDWQSASTGVGAALQSWAAGLQDVFSADARLVPAILFMGFISGALVLWGETLLMKEVPSTETGVIFATEPVWAAAFAAILLQEAVTPQEMIGGGAIVLACLALQLPEERVLAVFGGQEK